MFKSLGLTNLPPKLILDLQTFSIYMNYVWVYQVYSLYYMYWVSLGGVGGGG